MLSTLYFKAECMSKPYKALTNMLPTCVLRVRLNVKRYYRVHFLLSGEVQSHPKPKTQVLNLGNCQPEPQMVTYICSQTCKQ